MSGDIERGWTILPLDAVQEQERARADIDRIFYVSSATQSFPSEAARAAFHERWLGRYLKHHRDLVFVARADDGSAFGYIAGAAEDPATLPRFADLPFTIPFAHLSRDFPAHLHVNCAPEWRGRGIGAALVATFAEAVHKRGARGLHLVTGANSRNRVFYAREGFEERGRWGEPGKEAVFLAKRI